MLPPGAVVGVIWTLLFLAMGLARWMVARTGVSRARWIDCLALACLLYPLYTAGLRSVTIGFWGTIATFVLGLAVLIKIRPTRAAPAALLSLVLMWLAYAGTALGVSLRR